MTFYIKWTLFYVNTSTIHIHIEEYTINIADTTVYSRDRPLGGACLLTILPVKRWAREWAGGREEVSKDPSQMGSAGAVCRLPHSDASRTVQSWMLDMWTPASPPWSHQDWLYLKLSREGVRDNRGDFWLQVSYKVFCICNIFLFSL